MDRTGDSIRTLLLVYTDVMFSMDGHSSAPLRVGSLLVPQAEQYYIRWVDRGDRAYVTLMVKTSLVDPHHDISLVEDMVAKVCGMHPSVRCISRTDVLPATTVIEDAAS